MDEIDNKLSALDAAIGADPLSARPYIDRGKFQFGSGGFGDALNDFIKARELEPENIEIHEYIRMINEILDFRYTDIYNP